MEIPSWRETNGPEVWLAAGDDDRGPIDDLAAIEAEATARATPPAVLGANADAEDAVRIRQLLEAGYSRTFSWVRLEIETAQFDTPPPTNSRSATTVDAESMLLLSASVWGARAYVTLSTLESIQSWLTRSDLSLFQLTHEGDELIGYVAGRDDGSGGLEIEDVQVAPSHQRRGLGGSLIRHALSVARGRQLERAWLMTEGDDPVGARAFYERVGFRLTAEALRFRKPIESHAEQKFGSFSERQTE